MYRVVMQQHQVVLQLQKQIEELQQLMVKQQSESDFLVKPNTIQNRAYAWLLSFDGRCVTKDKDEALEELTKQLLVCVFLCLYPIF